MIKLQIQLLAVEIALPFCRSLSGRISLGYTHTVAWNPTVKKPSNRNSITAAAMLAECATEVACST